VAVVAFILMVSLLATACGGDDVKTYSDAALQLKLM
jgi:hypothetical protein